jgi:hypothetical protein
MRLFSIMGAYALTANNECIHLSMFIVLLLYKPQLIESNVSSTECDA